MSNDRPYEVQRSAEMAVQAAVRRRSRAWIVIPIAAGLHLAAFVMVLMRSFGESMRSFDSGAAPTQLGRFCQVFTEVLGFPGLQLSRWLPGGTGTVAGWLLVMCNSLLWGIAAWMLVRGLWRGPNRRRGAQGGAF